MKFNEYKMDLFKVSSDCYLAHCISSDFVLGRGIAKSFQIRGVKQYLQSHYPTKWNGSGYALLAPIEGFQGVYNIITKKRYFMKPTYQTLREALNDMKNNLPNNCKLAIPYIGCGLDKLEWNQVKNILFEVFKNSNIEILACKL